MHSIVRILAVAIMVLAPDLAHAQRDRDSFTSIQPIEVSGYVRMSELGEPARNVLVRLERFSGGVIEQMHTDNQGRFRFGGLPRGYYAVIIEAPGFQPARQPADLQVLFKVFLVFELAPSKSDHRSVSELVVDVRVPETARDEYAKARAALFDKKPKEAIAHLKKAIATYTDFFEAHLLLGTSLMDLRRWQEAQAALVRALEIKPESSDVMLSLGESYWRQKNYDNAERRLIEGLKLDDKNWRGHFTLGRLYWEKGEVMKAAPVVGRTIQLKPDLAEAHLLAGNVLLKLTQPRRALIEYEEYIRLAPKGEFAQEVRNLIQKLRNAGVKSP
jgi:tetratricopeptide (TPR) repeat protein